MCIITKEQALSRIDELFTEHGGLIDHNSDDGREIDDLVDEFELGVRDMLTIHKVDRDGPRPSAQEVEEMETQVAIARLLASALSGLPDSSDDSVKLEGKDGLGPIPR